VSSIPKKTFYLQFCMGTPKGHQKTIFNTPKVKKKQRYMWGSIRKSLQAQPKNRKKSYRNTKNTNQDGIFLKILCFVPSKCEGAKN
jgi:hypothetical protein